MSSLSPVNEWQADGAEAHPLNELRGPMAGLAAAVIAGIVLGHVFAWLWVWLGVATLMCVGMGVCAIRQKPGAVRVWGVLAFVALSASWLILRSGYTAGTDLAWYVGESSQLARVTGTIVEPAKTGTPAGGAFARFSYEPPSTRFVLRADAIEIDGRWVKTRGDLIVRIDQADHRPRVGQRIEVTGWLGAIAGPRNIGEFDFRSFLAERGIVGRLTMSSRENWRPVDQSGLGVVDAQRRFRSWCSDAALASLRLGMSTDTPTLGLLETMLLGRKDGSNREVRLAFRQVGLSHLLSISGAHLGILLGLVWMLTRWFVPNPPRAAMIVLAVLMLYLMAVPLRVPIVRSGIMAGLFCAAYASGRRVKPIQVLAFAACIVLLWRPTDLFTPGFQLSFGAVAGLILFVQPVSDWLWPRPEVLPGHLSAGWVIGRWCVDYLSVSLVAFSVVAPLVAYHFQMVNPLSVLLSVMALPVLTAVLGVGYLKILVGLGLPSAGLILSGPLDWLGDSLRGLVDHAGRWPGAMITLVWQPSVVWVIGLSLLILAGLSGAFVQRRKALTAAVLLMAVWTVAGQSGRATSWQGTPTPQAPAALLTMFAVGDGSCYLLQLPGHTLMFDCGSQQYFDIAESSILPALKRMGVTRIDTLILSHADIDHYGGSLDLIDGITVGRVLVPPQLLAAAETRPWSASGHLVEGLAERGLMPTTIQRGWMQTLQDSTGARLEALWPPADYEPKRVNDTSVVLSIHVAGRRILLNGDVQTEAMQHLMALEDLVADVTDLPHHGSVVDGSAEWLERVGPQIILQSCGRTRIYQDKWPALLEDSNAARLVTARDGMSQVRITPDGTISHWTLVKQNQPRIHANTRE